MKWPISALDSIAILDRQSIHPSLAEAATPYLGLEHLDGDGGINCIQTVGSAGLKSNKFQFSDRHVLFGKLRPYLRKIARPEFSGVCSTDIIPILPKDGVSRDYLFYFLRTPDTVNLGDESLLRREPSSFGPETACFFPNPPPAPRRAEADCGDSGCGGRLAGQAPRGPRPARHPPPIHLPRHVRRSRHQSDGVTMVTCVGELWRRWEHRSTPSRNHKNYFGGSIPWVKSTVVWIGEQLRLQVSVCPRDGVKAARLKLRPKGKYHPRSCNGSKEPSRQGIVCRPWNRCND